MSVDWGSLGIVTVVGAATALTVVTLVALAVVGLSDRPDGSSATGRAVAGLCLLAVGVIAGYGLYVIAA
ncbi:hypothetical protein [Pseudonocardia zijingensis]|uniref:Uncharacterized protein n=1 Tax=Pseudonocardia zijingensis TaxID=153376 RepID=A0ABP4AC37_9PSEU